MKGFLWRDGYLLALNIKFYLIFTAAMAALCVFSDFKAGFLLFYVMLFCASSLIGLFSYDEVNHWQGYAAAAPHGRKAQVDARYALALLVSGVGTAFLLALCLLSKMAGGWAMALLYGGMMLIYIDVVFPLSYRFGNKSRLIMILILAVLAGGIGVGSSMVVISGGMDSDKTSLAVAAVPLVAMGLVGMVISHRVSVAIMERKEL